MPASDVEFIVHMAAETHVDNSIADPVPFIKNNVNSTLTMLEWARELKSLRAFFYFSTDEVYGPALDGALFKENARHHPAPQAAFFFMMQVTPLAVLNEMSADVHLRSR